MSIKLNLIKDRPGIRMRSKRPLVRASALFLGIRTKGRGQKSAGHKGADIRARDKRARDKRAQRQKGARDIRG